MVCLLTCHSSVHNYPLKLGFGTSSLKTAQIQNWLIAIDHFPRAAMTTSSANSYAGCVIIVPSIRGTIAKVAPRTLPVVSSRISVVPAGISIGVAVVATVIVVVGSSASSRVFVFRATGTTTALRTPRAPRVLGVVTSVVTRGCWVVSTIGRAGAMGPFAKTSVWS